MIDAMKDTLILAAILVVIASVLSIGLGMVLGPLYAVAGVFQTVLGGVIALALLFVVAAKTELEKETFVNIVTLFVAVGLVGSVITVFIPAATQYIISVQSFTNLTSIAWSIVYIGLAMAVKEKVM